MLASCEKIDSTKPNPELIQKAVQLLKNEQAIAFPTETVYGLGGDAFSTKAVEAIYEIKGRPHDKPLPVMVADLSMVSDLVSDISEEAKALMKAFWPGPLTIIFPAKPILSPRITAGNTTVGIRFPNHAVPLQLIQALGHPIVAPSANLSGNQAPITAEDVYSQLAQKIPLILDGGICPKGKESTIVDCTSKPVKILRIGALAVNDIAGVIQR